MPACFCAFCQADREGRSDEFLALVVMAMELDTTVMNLCAHSATRIVRTLRHPIRGIRECANCYMVLEEPAEAHKEAA